jgi:signal transduction histidine kinase
LSGCVNSGQTAPSSAGEADVDREFRRRFVFANVAVLLIIGLGAATAIVALDWTTAQLDEARAIDHRLIMIDRMRAETRELGLAARRYVMVGDLQEQQRALAIVHDIKAQRDRLAARATLANGALLEAELDEFIASLNHAMGFDDADPIVRLSKFEDELARIRGPLALQFDDVVSRERARRESLRSTLSLARYAQWAISIASLLGAVLVVGTGAGVLRRTRATPLTGDLLMMKTGASALRRESLDAVALTDRAIKDHRSAAHERGIRLRYEAQLATTIFGDAERIKHVLDSLLQIAIEAARPGAELVVHVSAADAGVRFAIIEPQPAAEPVSGHDLVLQQCDRIVEAHGGRLGIQSSPISRTYWFTLPAEPVLLR